MRKTIEVQEGQISAQSHLIEKQLLYIHELEAKLDRRQEAPTATGSNDLKLLEEISNLRAKNKHLEEAQERLQEGFELLFNIQMENLDRSLAVLEKLPASPETKSLYTRCKKQSLAIMRAKEVGQASPLNALRQIADLERDLSQFITNRPLLTFTRSDRYRAEVLISTLHRDSKPISTVEAVRILAEVEGKALDPTQALRAMRWAATFHPDQAKFEKRGPRRKAWLCKTNIKETKK